MRTIGGGFDHLNWRKATYSMGHGECVEVASPQGVIAVRDSKNPDGFVVKYSAVSWRSFIAKYQGRGPVLRR
jgi:hypothetical protein